MKETHLCDSNQSEEHIFIMESVIFVNPVATQVSVLVDVFCVVNKIEMSAKHLKIQALHLNAMNFNVTGLIIGKSYVSTYEKPRQQDQVPTSLCGVVKFLIRDSCDHFINVAVWGTENFVTNYNSLYTIGDVVNVLNCKISSVRHDDTFNPITSSPLQLTINEGFGLIEPFDGNTTEMVKLLNVPLKSPDLALNLADVASTPSVSDADNLVDLFVVVAKLRPARKIGHRILRDIVVFDETLPGMFMTIWNEAWTKRSESWNEMSTVLHLINVGFKYSKYHKSIVLVVLSRTVIIVDPIGERSASLKEYASRSTLMFTELDAVEPDLSTITTVMSIQQINNRLNDASGDAAFFSLTFAIITQMDIDGWTLFYSTRCIYCNCRMRTNDTSCKKEDCSMFFAENPLNQHFINYFNIPVHITDHTGTLQCRLIGDTAERILGYTLNDFLKLTAGVRTAIKWKFLMDRCMVKLSIKRRTALQWHTQINIVDCQVASIADVVEKIKVY